MSPRHMTWAGSTAFAAFLGGAFWFAGAHYDARDVERSDVATGQAQLAMLLSVSGQPESALALARQATQSDSHSGHAYYALGSVLGDQRQDREAIAALEKAVLWEPNWVDPRILLGSLLIRVGQVDEGIAQLEIVKDDPQAQAQLEMARAQLNERRDQQ